MKTNMASTSLSTYDSLVAKGALQEFDGGRTASGRPAKLVRLPIGQLELIN